MALTSIKVGLATMFHNLSKTIYVDRVKGHSDIVLITSVGRSGSTFFSQLLSTLGRFRSYFEPLHDRKVPQAKGLESIGFIRPGQQCSEYDSFFNRLFRGDIYNDWISQGNTSYYFDKRVIKTIRANVNIPWIRQRFPKIKLIVLMRSPFSVVDSWVNMNFGDGNLARQRALEDKNLVNALPALAIETYRKAGTPRERLLFQWCISYYLIFSLLSEDDFKLVVYEQLVQKPEYELKEIADYIGVSMNEKWKKIIRKPSFTTSKNSEIRNGGESKNKIWGSEWSAEELEKAKEILSCFKMDTCYLGGKLPDKSRLLADCKALFKGSP